MTTQAEDLLAALCDPCTSSAELLSPLDCDGGMV
jgi:hypothetical protein